MGTIVSGSVLALALLGGIAGGGNPHQPRKGRNINPPRGGGRKRRKDPGKRKRAGSHNTHRSR